MSRISLACLNILEQLGNVVADIEPHDFTCPSATLSGSSIGQHIRHTIEFFICLESGFESGVINYDKRAHDKSIETDRTRTLIVLDRIRMFIINNPDNRSLVLQGIYDANSTEIYSIDTNFFRELSYNIEHAVHHMAMIKIGIAEVAPYLRLPAGFGVAASTIQYASVKAGS